jgi:hypothetical protein
MNPTVEQMPQMPTFLVSKEKPTTVENTAATCPQTSTDEAITGTRTLSKPEQDKRRSSRRTIPKARQSCELKVGARVLSALLVNESHGGFAVLIDRLCWLEVGKKVEVHTDMGWFMARIIYINKVARPKAATSKCDSWFQLGMKKIGGCFSS